MGVDVRESDGRTAADRRIEAARRYLRAMSDPACGNQPRDRRADSSPEETSAYGLVEKAWLVSKEAGEDPRILALRDEALSRRPRSASFWRAPAAYAAAAAAAAFLIVGGMNMSLLRKIQGRADTAERHSYATGPGQMSTIRLSDGTAITLNAKSAVDLEFGDNGDTRAAVKKGEVLFEVAKQHDRHFAVTVNDSRIDVVGTVFNVRTDGDVTEVALAKGKIRLRPSGPRPTERTVYMKPGELAVAGPMGLKLSNADIGELMIWREGRMRFRDAPLDAVARELSRYSPKAVVVGDSRIKHLRVSGTFKTSQIDSITTTLAETLPIRFNEEADRIVILPAK